MPHGCCSIPSGMSCPDVLFATPQLEYFNRRRLRTVGNVVSEDPCNDFFLTIFCFPLVVCQDGREIRSRELAIARTAQQQRLGSNASGRSSDFFDCCQGPASVNLRTIFCPCVQVALNRAVMEGDIEIMPEDLCAFPHGVSFCDALMSVVTMEHYTHRRIEAVKGYPRRDSLIACMEMLFCWPLKVCQDARDIIAIQAEVVPVIRAVRCDGVTSTTAAPKQGLQSSEDDNA